MRLCLEEADLWKERKSSVIEKINQRKLPLVLFGRAYPVDPSFLKEITVPVQYICDNNRDIWGTRFWGLDVIPPFQLSQIYRAYTVLILVPFEQEIVPQLQQLAVPPAEIFRLDLYFEEEGTASYFEAMQDAISDTYARLADQKSKDTYEAAIQYRISRNATYLNHIVDSRSKQYFFAALGESRFLGADEIFVDVGAFTGDTVCQFIAAVRGKYRAIYAFEPDAKAWEKLLKNTAGYRDISCQKVGIGRESQMVNFSSGGSSSRVDGGGEQRVQIEALDNMLSDVPVTYLKMDIEGMEQPALQGAKRLIQTYRPKLAICAYHSNADMVQIPQLIWEINPAYNLYFRHYSHSLVETICYAI